MCVCVCVCVMYMCEQMCGERYVHMVSYVRNMSMGGRTLHVCIKLTIGHNVRLIWKLSLPDNVTFCCHSNTCTHLPQLFRRSESLLLGDIGGCLGNVGGTAVGGGGRTSIKALHTCTIILP